VKKRACSYNRCHTRRADFLHPDDNRGIQYVDVPDDYPDDKPAYCSTSCGAMDKNYNVKPKDPKP
jgi:hypothetical protein